MPNANELTTLAGQQIARQPRLPGTEPTMLEMIQQTITSGEVPAEKLPQVLNAFFDFQLRVQAVEAEKQFNAAFAAAMIKMPRVSKRGKKDMGTKGVIPYETYEDLDAAIRPIETEFGFARSFLTRPAPDGKRGCIMVLRLTHRGGHSITSERYCPPDPGPGRAGIQEEGSGESYGRRYATKAVWNIVTVGADDDGDSADPISDEQALELRTMLDYLAPTPKWYEQWWAWVGPEQEKRVEAIQRKDWDRVRGDLKLRVKSQEEKRKGGAAEKGGAR
jgi:hypothetical protein